MGTICRLCLHKNDLDSMKDVFEFPLKYFEMSLIDVLYWTFDVEVCITLQYMDLEVY